MKVKDIVRIVIKGESGYCGAEEAYNDKVTITKDSVQRIISTAKYQSQMRSGMSSIGYG